MRLSLMHKGFLLVSIPLCFELAIFAKLMALQNDMAQESARINKSRLIGDTVNQITRNALVLEDTFKYSRDPLDAAKKIRFRTDDMAKQFTLLERLTVSDPTLHGRVLDSLHEVHAAQAELSKLSEMLASDSTVDPLDAANRFGPSFRIRLRRIVSMGLLELASTSAKEIDTDRTAAMRIQTVQLLKFAVAASALIALIGAWTFSRHMISRLQVVVKNADRLGARQELLNPVKGNDEIADLDSALHDAAQLIQRLEQAREEVIGMVSHDIRSPLATIKCTSDALEDRLEGAVDARAKELFKVIDSNCDRILRISKDLLDMQKIEAGMLSINKEPTELKDCLLAALDATEGLLQNNRGVTIEADLTAIKATVDEGRIEQVVTNLLSNAIKHSPRNGKIHLILETMPDQKQVRIAVRDNGKGIPAEMKNSIFDRFKQVNADDSNAGTGLGLAISKALVELHGGQIGIADVSPTGSEFWILLPKSA